MKYFGMLGHGVKENINKSSKFGLKSRKNNLGQIVL